MKTILIPTDFNVNSLACITNLCADFQPKELNLIFLHAFGLSDSMTELLMLSRRSKENEHISDEFYAGCNDLKASCTQINSIRIDFFYGNTVNVFRNFVEEREIDLILHPEFCSYSKLNKNSIDLSKLAERCGIPTFTVVKRAKLQPAEVEIYTAEELLEESIA